MGVFSLQSANSFSSAVFVETVGRVTSIDLIDPVFYRILTLLRNFLKMKQIALYRHIFLSFFILEVFLSLPYALSLRLENI